MEISLKQKNTGKSRWIGDDRISRSWRKITKAFDLGRGMESDGVRWYRFKGMKSLESLGVPLKNTTVSVRAEFSFESRFFFSLDFF